MLHIEQDMEGDLWGLSILFVHLFCVCEHVS